MVSAIAVVVRLFLWGRASGVTRYVLFALVWFVLCMAPAYQVGDYEHLQGSRFIYLGTAPLCFLLSTLLLPLSTSNAETGMNKFINLKSFRILGCLLLTLFVVVFILIFCATNATWARAGNEVRALREAIEYKCQLIKTTTVSGCLQLAATIGCVHELYNAAMLNVLLQEPLTREQSASRVITFKPMTYTEYESSTCPA